MHGLSSAPRGPRLVNLGLRLWWTTRGDAKAWTSAQLSSEGRLTTDRADLCATWLDPADNKHRYESDRRCET